MCVCVCVYTYMCAGAGLDTKLYLTLTTPCTIACQAPLSVGFSRQEYWSGVGCHAFLERIFQIQGSNPSLLWLLHCR